MSPCHRFRCGLFFILWSTILPLTYAAPPVISQDLSEQIAKISRDSSIRRLDISYFDMAHEIASLPPSPWGKIQSQVWTEWVKANAAIISEEELFWVLREFPKRFSMQVEVAESYLKAQGHHLSVSEVRRLLALLPEDLAEAKARLFAEFMAKENWRLTNPNHSPSDEYLSEYDLYLHSISFPLFPTKKQELAWIMANLKKLRPRTLDSLLSNGFSDDFATFVGPIWKGFVKTHLLELSPEEFLAGNQKYVERFKDGWPNGSPSKTQLELTELYLGAHASHLSPAQFMQVVSALPANSVEQKARLIESFATHQSSRLSPAEIRMLADGVPSTDSVVKGQINALAAQSEQAIEAGRNCPIIISWFAPRPPEATP